MDDMPSRGYSPGRPFSRQALLRVEMADTRRPSRVPGYGRGMAAGQCSHGRSLIEIGLRTKAAQSERAKQPRGKVTDAGETLSQLIKELVLQRQYRHNTAKDYGLAFLTC